MKVNFNVPFLSLELEQEMQPKTDKTKQRYDPNTGGSFPSPVLDNEGNVVMECIQLKTVINSLLMAPYKGDEDKPFDDRLKRAKLARKIVTSSTANYRDEELAMIKELAAKSRATLVLLNVDWAINGREEDEATVEATGDTTTSTNGEENV